MAVYERTYRPYEGALTPEWSRFLILPRYAYKQAFRSRILLIFLVLCMVPTAVAACLIYLHHNVTALAMLHLDVSNLVPVNPTFFYVHLNACGALSFFIALFMGTALISPDLANNGLALYFSRPFTRREYLFGKFCVLAILMSIVTWVPAILLFLFQSYLEGWAWFSENLFVAKAILLASWQWIVLVSLMAMAASAWVRRRPIAAALMLAFYFVSKGMGTAVNLMYRTHLGDLIDVSTLTSLVWKRLFHFEVEQGVSTVSAWASLILFCAFCLWLLIRKIRAYQVVR